MKSSSFLFCLTLSILLGSQGFSEPVALFNGSNLDGWKPLREDHGKFWTVVDGVITGSNQGKKVPTNTYLISTQEYGDFEFQCRFRISGDHSTGLINSGIQYRSILKNGNIIGYQADIGKGYWGDLYDEHRRGKLVKGETDELAKSLIEDAWNDYRIVCKGNHHQLFINGIKTADYIEKDDVPAKGHLGLQLHSGGAAKIEFKDLTIETLKP